MMNLNNAGYVLIRRTEVRLIVVLLKANMHDENGDSSNEYTLILTPV